MNLPKTTLLLALSLCISVAPAMAQQKNAAPPALAFALQPLAHDAGEITIPGIKGKVFYVPSTLATVKWGYLPNANDKPVLTVPSGATIVFDTLSHEGLLEDQGRDPVKYFADRGVPANMILRDAIDITQSRLPHDFRKDGPHIVTGPVAIDGAEPGDVLKVDVLSIVPRVPYGVISSRHGKGALPGEFPETPQPEEDADAAHPEKFHNVSVFTPIRKTRDGHWEGLMKNRHGTEVVFPATPFMGVMGVASAGTEQVHSVPPGPYGGNIDINELGVGSTVYLPVFVKGGNFYTGDPHMAQGDGEVALTALEHSLRPTFRITLLKKGDKRIPSASGSLLKPFGETKDFWIPIGLDPDLNLAMKDAVRESIRFLTEVLGMERDIAYAYLSAATDYQVSQVVDKTKGIHGLIRKSDFNKVIKQQK